MMLEKCAKNSVDSRYFCEDHVIIVCALQDIQCMYLVVKIVLPRSVNSIFIVFEH